MTTGHPIYGPDGPIEPSAETPQVQGGAPADAWIRLGARLLDQLALGVLYVLVFGLGTLLSGGALLTVFDPISAAILFDDRLVRIWSTVVIAACVLIGPLYFALSEMFTGQTLGKMALGLRVLDDRGHRPGFIAAFARNLFMLVPIIVLVPVLGPVLFYLLAIAVGFWIGISISHDRSRRGAHERRFGLSVVHPVQR